MYFSTVASSGPALASILEALPQYSRVLEYLDLRHNAADTSEEVCEAIVKVRASGRFASPCSMLTNTTQNA